MATATKIRWHGACPKHPRYNPEKGVGAIKAGCGFCYQLHLIHDATSELTRKMRLFDGDVAEWKQEHETPAETADE